VRYGLSIDERVMFKMVNAEGRRYLTDVHSDMDPWRRRRDPYGGRQIFEPPLAHRSRGLSYGKKTRICPMEDTADMQRDRGCNPDGAGAIEAKRPEGRHPQLRKAKLPRRGGARSRRSAVCCATEGGIGNFLKLPVAISGCVPELDILSGLFEFLSYHIESCQLRWTEGR
jgi:hypothetical protein